MHNQTEIIFAAERLAERLKRNSEDDCLDRIYKNKPEVLAHTILLLQTELKKIQAAMETIMEQACMLCPEQDNETVKEHMNLWFRHEFEGKEYDDADKLSIDLDVRDRLRQKCVKLVQLFQQSLPIIQVIDRIKKLQDAQADEILENFGKEPTSECCVLF